MSVISLSIMISVILIVIFIFLGIWFRKAVVTSEDFLLAGRRAPFWLLASSYLGGMIGGASISGYMSTAYNSGISQAWLMLFAYLFSTLFVILFARRLNYFGRKTGAVTLADFVCARFGEKLRAPISIVAFLRPAFLTGMQLLAIAIVINIAFGLPIKYGIIVSAVVIVLYMITAGQYSAMITQWLQGILQSVGIVLFTITVIKIFGSPQLAVDAIYETLDPLFLNPTNIDFSMLSVWILTLGLFYLVDPWMYMWSYLGKDPRTTSNAQLAILAGSYYGIIPYLAGLLLLAAGILGLLVIPDGLSSDALYAWFSMNNTPIAIGTLIIVGLLMTVVSCGSSFAMNGVTILTKDIYQKIINKNSTDKQVLVASRVALVIVMLIAIVGAIWLPILVPLWVLAQALALSGILVPTLSAWFWKRATSTGAWFSTVLGVLAGICWAFYAWKTTGSPGGLVHGLHAAHIGIAVSLPVMIIVSLATKPQYENAEATNYRTLGKEMLENNPEFVIAKNESVFFGWLGAKTGGVKFLWIIGFALFLLHYILVALFATKSCGLILTWISILACIGLIIIVAIFGGKDVIAMHNASKPSGSVKE